MTWEGKCVLANGLCRFENDLREQMIKYIEQRVDNLWEKFKEL